MTPHLTKNSRVCRVTQGSPKGHMASYFIGATLPFVILFVFVVLMRKKGF